MVTCSKTGLLVAYMGGLAFLILKYTNDFDGRVALTAPAILRPDIHKQYLERGEQDPATEFRDFVRRSTIRR